MKRLFKSVVLSCAVLVSAAFGSSASAYPAEVGVKVQLNDRLISFPEAQPFIDERGQMLVPVRQVFEALGYRVEGRQEGDSLAVTMKSAKREIRLKAGSAEAVMDGKQVKLPAAASNRQGTVYVPLRVLSESLGYMVQWDDVNGIAIICEDGKYHSPAWYAPTLESKVMDTAKSFMGVPYAWGGTTPNGFDCSGFVNFVFDGFGIDLPRTSREMLAAAGQPVTELKPGDLVFFNISRSVGHVGIYLGDGNFISATTSRGVTIDSLYSYYWSPKYIGAKRIL